MRIRKDEGAKKIFIIVVIILAAIVLVTAYVSKIIVTNYEEIIYENDANIVSVLKDYPEAEISAIRAINEKTEVDTQAGKETLRKYGINNSTIKTLSSEFYNNTIMLVLPALLGFFIISAILIVFIEKQFKRINEITNYSQHVLQKDYSLDIRENVEGDISNLKNEIYKLTVMLREQAEQQQKDKERLSTALSDISHQLKTPMTSLYVMTDLIKKDDLPYEKKQEFMDTIHNQLDRINWLVSSLLTLSKLDARTIKMKMKKHEIKELVKAALEPVAIPAELKNISINIEAKKACFHGDFYWSREALVNILKNCIEHTAENGEINILFEENRLYSELKIKDNGEGISKEDLKHIFKRFYKGKNASEGSAGIGLAMARSILREQDGDITCKSKKNIGTEFILKWPKRM